MKKELFINIDIQELEGMIRNCVRVEIQKIVNNNENSELMKAIEVCEYLRISKVTLYKWLNQGKITGYYLGSRLFFKKSEIEKSLTKKEVKK